MTATECAEQRLVEALRFGGGGPGITRRPDDLGRFGLGLKTASLSQCRKLTVVSQDVSSRSAFTWDIDRLATPDSGWDLIVGDDGLESKVAKTLAHRPGTLVVWRSVDFGRTEDKPDRPAFLHELERLELHLGMVFHRFLSGDARQTCDHIERPTDRRLGPLP